MYLNLLLVFNYHMARPTAWNSIAIIILVKYFLFFHNTLLFHNHAVRLVLLYEVTLKC